MAMKIFGIGLHKTGTTTLAECFRILGYRVCPESEAYPTIPDVVKNLYRHCLLLARAYDAFMDSPWHFIDTYKVLDAVFPTAKFILTVRNEDHWYKSSLRWVSLNDTSGSAAIMATLGTGFEVNNKDEMVAAYRKHNHEVMNYFGKLEENDGQQRLLVVDWERGDGWEKLCPFLDKPIPDRDFPHMLKYDAEMLKYVDTVRRRGRGT